MPLGHTLCLLHPLVVLEGLVTGVNGHTDGTNLRHGLLQLLLASLRHVPPALQRRSHVRSLEVTLLILNTDRPY